jgi:hypothetical protein
VGNIESRIRSLLHEDLQEYVYRFSDDPALRIEILLDGLNGKVATATMATRFRRLTMEALMNRALRIWDETQDRDQFEFFRRLQGYMVQWLINQGLPWSPEKRKEETSLICFHILEWFKKAYNRWRLPHSSRWIPVS